jgi:hypothetical protein
MKLNRQRTFGIVGGDKDVKFEQDLMLFDINGNSLYTEDDDPMPEFSDPSDFLAWVLERGAMAKSKVLHKAEICGLDFLEIRKVFVDLEGHAFLRDGEIYWEFLR